MGDDFSADKEQSFADLVVDHFEKFDTDRNGKLSPDETSSAYQAKLTGEAWSLAGAFHESEQRVRELVRDEGFIEKNITRADINELIRIEQASEKLSTLPYIVEDFDFLDSLGKRDGYLTLSELEAMKKMPDLPQNLGKQLDYLIANYSEVKNSHLYDQPSGVSLPDLEDYGQNISRKRNALSEFKFAMRLRRPEIPTDTRTWPPTEE